MLETHTHADHVSGHGRLALEHGVPVHVHAAAEAAFPHEPLADGTEIERRRRRAPHDPHAGPPAGALRLRRDRPLARRRAVARPDGRLALRRRRGAARSRGRGARRRRRALPLAAASRRAGRRRRGVSRARRRLALRRGDELEGIDDDRLRAPLQSWRSATRTTSSSRTATGPQPPRPPNMEAIVELNRGAVPRRAAAARAARHRARRRGRARRTRRARLRGRTPARSRERPRLRLRRSARRSAFVLPERPVVIDAADEAEARARRAASLRQSASSICSAGAQAAAPSESSR